MFRAKRQAGFTYVEFIMASAITLMVATAIMYFMLFSGRSLLAMSNYCELDSKARQALDRMTREIRQATGASAYATNSLTLTMASGTSVTFSYDANKRQLLRTESGQTTVLLSQCDQTTFRMFGRVPASGTFDLVQVSTPAECKAVNISWLCSRTFVGSAIHTDNTTSAMIALRMK
jgi:hypothetical protein